VARRPTVIAVTMAAAGAGERDLEPSTLGHRAVTGRRPGAVPGEIGKLHARCIFGSRGTARNFRREQCLRVDDANLVSEYIRIWKFLFLANAFR
jgi:hypothetical protein